ncbi:MAG: AraC family transcriptional regulator [Spirochaetota bacterium]
MTNPVLSPLGLKLAQANNLYDQSGFVQTEIPSVKVFLTPENTARTPVIYNPGLVFILQGRKRAFLEDKYFDYNPDKYLVLGVPMPLECVTYASSELPLIGIFIEIKIEDLLEQIRIVNSSNVVKVTNRNKYSHGVEQGNLNKDLQESLQRLIKTMLNPIEIKILGPSLVKEVLLRTLLNNPSGVLHNLSVKNGKYAKISWTLYKLHQNYSQPIEVNKLAAEEGMSESTFFRIFRTITSDTPIQYLKKIRLNKAKIMLVHDDVDVQTVAERVGYSSATQFSREFKRFFGRPPSEASKLGYKALKY